MSTSRRRWFGTRGGRTGLLFAAPAMLFLLVFVAYPVVDAVRLSVLEVDFVTGSERFVGARNYAEVIHSPKFWPVLINTLIWSVGSLVGQFALGLAAALCINQNL